jgi:chromosome segregation ATPase
MAVKTPVKKPLKASKKPEKRATITLDELRKSQNEAWKAIKEGRKNLEEFSERQEKANLELREFFREFFKESSLRMENSHKELEKSLNESHQNTVKELRESHLQTAKELRESHLQTEKELKESKKHLDKAMGDLGRKLGSIVEHIMVPDLPKKFKALGYSIDRIATYKYTKEGVYAQIDALLENGKLAIAVEVKTTLRQEDIDKHLLRMDKVRQHADKNGDTRQFLCAMAATVTDKSIKTYALNQGLFIIEPSGENIKVTKPPQERVW